MDKKTLHDIAEGIRQFCRDQSNISAINKLIEIASEIVRQKLRARINAAAYREDVSSRRQSLSVIAGLFTKEGKHRFCQAISEFLDCDDITLFTKFQSIVVNSARQELFHRWGEADSLKARIWRNVKQALNNDERFAVFPNDNPEYVCLSGSDELRSNLPCLNTSEIAAIAAEIHHLSRNFSDFLVSLLMEIKKMDHCSFAIRKDDLIAALYMNESLNAEDEIKKWFPERGPDPEIELTRKEIIASIWPKIETRLKKYCETNKLSDEITGYFSLALADLLYDYTLGGPDPGHYKYLRIHWKELTYEDFRSLYWPIFQYLAKIINDEYILFMRNYYK